MIPEVSDYYEKNKITKTEENWIQDALDFFKKQITSKELNGPATYLPYAEGYKNGILDVRLIIVRREKDKYEQPSKETT